MLEPLLNTTRRVILVFWKDREKDPFEVFSNLKVFAGNYPGYSYHTLNNYLSKRRVAFEDDRVRIERKGLISKTMAPLTGDGKPFEMARVVRKTTMKGLNEAAENLDYWLSRPPVERLAAVGFIVGQSLKRGQRMDKKIVKKIKMKRR